MEIKELSDIDLAKALQAVVEYIQKAERVYNTIVLEINERRQMEKGANDGCSKSN